MSAKTSFYGMYKGIVVNNVDPEGLDRITAIIPQVFGNATTASGWAWPCMPVIGTTVPTPGAGVWISFEGGDVDYPIWNGVWAPPAAATVAPVTPVTTSNEFSTVYLGTDDYVSLSRGNDIYGNGQVLFKQNGPSGPVEYIMYAAGLYPTTPLSLGNSLAPWGTLYCQAVTYSGTTVPIGGRGAYNQVTAPYTNTATVGFTFYGAAASTGTAPVITLPNDGATYRVEFFATYWYTSTANICYVGIGTSVSNILSTVQNALGTGVTTQIPPLTLNVVASGQTLSVYTATSTAGYTVGFNAGTSGGSTPSFLAAYRVL